MFDHKVTGEELNNVIRDLQDGFGQINENIRQIYNMSGIVFTIADALESDYLCKFQRSLDEALESGRKAVKTAEDLKKQQAVLVASVKAIKRVKEKQEPSDFGISIYPCDKNPAM